MDGHAADSDTLKTLLFLDMFLCYRLEMKSRSQANDNYPIIFSLAVYFFW